MGFEFAILLPHFLSSWILCGYLIWTNYKIEVICESLSIIWICEGIVNNFWHISVSKVCRNMYNQSDIATRICFKIILQQAVYTQEWPWINCWKWGTGPEGLIIPSFLLLGSVEIFCFVFSNFGEIFYFKSKTSRPDIVAHTCNISIQEAETGGDPRVSGQAGLHNEFRATWMP